MKKLNLILGILFLGLTVVGIMIPIFPQVPFAIIAAFFFARSSERLHNWIRNNRSFGSYVRDWEDHHIVRPKLKWISSISMVISMGLAHWRLSTNYAIIIDVIFIACIIFVATRKSELDYMEVVQT